LKVFESHLHQYQGRNYEVMLTEFLAFWLKREKIGELQLLVVLILSLWLGLIEKS